MEDYQMMMKAYQEADENGILEMVAKAYGYGEDKIRVKESGKLLGEGARGLIKSRIAVREKADWIGDLIKGLF